MLEIAEGTVKSKVSRGRELLAGLAGYDYRSPYEKAQNQTKVAATRKAACALVSESVQETLPAAE